MVNVLSRVIAKKKSKALSKAHDLDPASAYRKLSKFLSRQPGSTTLALGSEPEFAAQWAADPIMREVVTDLTDLELQIEEAMEEIYRLQTTISKLFSSGKRRCPELSCRPEPVVMRIMLPS